MRFATRNEAVEHIVAAIDAGGEAPADSYDIDAIAKAVLGKEEDGFAQLVDEDEFWQIVDDNALP